MKRRFITFMLAVVLLLTGCAGRILYISVFSSSAVAEGYNSYTVTVDTALPNIYYRDVSRLTNNRFSRSAVIRPTEKDIMEVASLFSDEEKDVILSELREGVPVIRNVDMDFKSKSIETYAVKRSENLCRSIISKECSGLLMHITDKGKTLKVNFHVDANGRFLSGDRGHVADNGYYGYKGIALTLDERIQEIAFEASEKLESGCVIIMDVKTSEILGYIVRPYSDYLNKPLCQYSVGSVFKTVIAACALENNVNYVFECKGETKIGDTVFSCQKNKRHGKETLKEALANSCNCYFANLALKLGRDRIIATAEALGFDSYTKLYNGWVIKNAALPKYSELSETGNIAQLGFGQGSLTASPLEICSLMCTLGNEGIYKEPALALGEVDEKLRLNPIIRENGKQTISKNTAKTLIEYLRYVVESGTGKSANYKEKSAGKTATAQTGQYINGKERLNTWFAGIYPFDEPKYAVVVMCDNGTSGAENCCPIFRTVVEMIDDM